jgi:sterol 24-C-methyltransferase
MASLQSRSMEGDLSRIKAITRKEKAQSRNEVGSAFSEYADLYDEKKGGSVEARKNNYTTMVNHFYDLATDFYEFGWGHSFHFATRHKWESFESSIARHGIHVFVFVAHCLRL